MDRYERIESYIMNVLPEADKQAFESQMESDPLLRDDVAAHAKMKMSLNELVEADVKSVISSIDKGSNPLVIKTRKLTRRRYLSIAASLLVLVCVGWWVTLPMSAEDAFNKYMKSPKDLATRSGEGIELDQATIDYYKAHQLLKDGNYSAAIIAFESIQLTEEHELTDNISWFIALSNLMIDKEVSVQQFKKLAEMPNHQYASKIKAILKDLNED